MLKSDLKYNSNGCSSTVLLTCSLRMKSRFYYFVVTFDPSYRIVSQAVGGAPPPPPQVWVQDPQQKERSGELSRVVLHTPWVQHLCGNKSSTERDGLVNYACRLPVQSGCQTINIREKLFIADLFWVFTTGECLTTST